MKFFYSIPTFGDFFLCFSFFLFVDVFLPLSHVSDVSPTFLPFSLSLVRTHAHARSLLSGCVAKGALRFLSASKAGWPDVLKLLF